MSLYKLDASTSKDIKYIWHMADIHIKNDQSTKDSYGVVFNNLYKTIRDFGKHDESLIVICGDIFDNKTNIKPDAIVLIKDFFSNLSSIGIDIVCIIGNHERPSINKDALDVLSALLTDTFSTKNKIFLLKDKYYEYNNLLFGVTDLYSMETTKFTFETSKIKIGLYHGYINGTKIDSGNEDHIVGRFNQSDFSTCDYVLLGDIHLHQYLNKKKTMAYPGSLLQLNFGESPEHGIIKWDLVNKTSSFIEIKNDYAYITVKVSNNKITSCPPIECKNIRLKFIWRNVDKLTRRQIISDFTSKYNVIELREIDDIRGISVTISDNNKNITDKLKNIYSTKALIDNYIDQRKYTKNISSKMKCIVGKLLDRVENVATNKERHIQLVSIKFNNLYVYGENNQIFFKNLQKIVGLLSPNKYGKSSLIEILIQSIWGLNTKNVSNDDILNYKKTWYSTEVLLIVNGVTYKILRNAKQKSKNNLQVVEMVDFYMIDSNKNEIKINEMNKKTTDSKIIDIVGDYDDYLKTCIMIQTNPYNFIDMTPADKKMFLYKIFRLDVFKKISKLANTQKNQLDTKICEAKKDIGNMKKKCLDKKDSKAKTKELDAISNELNKTINQTNEIKDKLCVIKYKIDETGLIINYDYDKLAQDLSEQTDRQNILLSEKNALSNVIMQYEREINNIVDEQQLIINKIDEHNGTLLQLLTDRDRLSASLIKVESDALYETYKADVLNIYSLQSNLLKQMNTLYADIQTNLAGIILVNAISSESIIFSNEYQKLCEEEIELVSKLDKSKSYVEHYIELYDDLSNHKYNQNCDICMTNTLTQKHLLIGGKLDSYKKEYDSLAIDITNIRNDQNTLRPYYDEYQNHKLVESINNDKMNQVMALENDVDILRDKLKIADAQLALIDMRNDAYVSNLSAINKNKEITQQIGLIDDKIKQIKLAINQLSTRQIDLANELSIIKKKKEKCEANLSNIKTTIENVCSDIATINDRIDIFKKNEKKILELKQHEKIAKELQKKIDDNGKIITKISNQQSALQSVLTSAKEAQIYCDDKQIYLDELELEKEIYDNIMSVLDRGGVCDKLLKTTIIPLLETTVNNILSCVENYGIKIYMDDSHIKIVKEHNNIRNNIVLNSGHERGIDNIIFRLAFCYMNNFIKTDFFIIDEGFKHSDEAHKDNLKSLFEYIRTTYNWCLVTTHDDYVKHNFDNEINIERIGGESLIKYT